MRLVCLNVRVHAHAPDLNLHALFQTQRRRVKMGCAELKEARC